ncbi:lipopolysaccharide biosynthesis protein [Amaricoccus tamworthensis]|uniref:lipopolysaccharide biosynthesis protein n=1 Tax=Amaricoccus tamworthensis TaxID=57002 RepID=UPI003C7DB826
MEVRALSIRRNVLYGLIGNVIFALTQWGIIAVVARMGSPEEVGAITVATALVTPIFFMAAMSMREGHSVDDLTEFNTTHYFALRLVNSVVAMLVICALVAMWDVYQGSLVQTTTLAFMLVKFVGTQANMSYGSFQRAQRLDFVAVSYAIRGVLGLAGFAAAYALTGALWVAFLVEALMWIGAQWFVDRRFLARLDITNRLSAVFEVRPGILLKLFLWMLPLGLAGFFVNATASAPRLVLAQHVDLSLVGVFGAIAYINTALATVTNAIGSASAAHLRRLVREGRRARFQKLSLKLVCMSSAIGVSILAVVWFAGPWILNLLYGGLFVDQRLFVLVILSTALRMAAAPLQFAMTAGHVFWRRLWINFAAFAVTLAAAVILIPSQGVYGAAYALLLGVAVRTLLLLVFFFRLSLSIQLPSGTESIPP